MFSLSHDLHQSLLQVNEDPLALNVGMLLKFPFNELHKFWNLTQELMEDPLKQSVNTLLGLLAPVGEEEVTKDPPVSCTES